MNMLTIWMWHWLYQSIYGHVRFPPALHALGVLRQPLHVSCPGSPAAFSERDPQRVLPAPPGAGALWLLRKALNAERTAYPQQWVLSGRGVGHLFLPMLCIFCLKKLNSPRGEKFFRTSLYAETGNTCVIHPEDERGERKPQGNRTSPPALLLCSSPLGSVCAGPCWSAARVPGCCLSLWAHVVATRGSWEKIQSWRKVTQNQSQRDPWI